MTNDIDALFDLVWQAIEADEKVWVRHCSKCGYLIGSNEVTICDACFLQNRKVA